jgi:hypothetical protein
LSEDSDDISAANGDANVFHKARKPDAAGVHDPVHGTTDATESGDENGRHPSGFGGAEPHDLSELRALMEKARRGDDTVLPRLRVLLDEKPGVLGDFGDLAKHAESEWIRTISGTDFRLAEALKIQIAALKSSLTGPSQTPVEGLLLAAVVVAWLNLNWTELVAAKLAQGEKILIKDWTHVQTSLNQAQRRYALAVGALVTYQRLLRSARDATVVVRSAECDPLKARAARDAAAVAAGFSPLPDPETLSKFGPSDSSPLNYSA